MRKEELAAFCEEQFPRLWGSLTLYCGDRFLAEEAAQEALVRCCANWARVRRMESPEAWIYKVGYNWLRSHHRRRVRQAEVLSRGLVQDDQGSFEGSQALLDLIRRLPERQRKAFILRTHAGFSVSEAATIVGCSDRTLKRLTSAAKERLTHELLLGETRAEVQLAL